jgi:hypothetical protein
MLKMLYRPLIAVTLLWVFILASMVTMVTLPHAELPLIYLSDYESRDEFYMVLDVETGQTHRFRRPSDFTPIQFYGGDGRQPDRHDTTSPYDDTVHFALLRDYNAAREDFEQLYRVRDDEQLEHIISGQYISFQDTGFTDNGRFVYLFTRTESAFHYTFYTLYRYDIQSTELSVVADYMPNAGLNCQADRCQLITGIPHHEDFRQSLYILHKNSGELHEVATADDINIHTWWGQNDVVYTPYDGDGQSLIYTYNLETDQHRLLLDIEGQGITGITRKYSWGASEYSPQNTPADDWLMVVATAPENSSIFDLYIINDLATNPTLYPLPIQTSNGTWLSYVTASDGSILMIAPAPRTDRLSNLYIINDMATQPTVDPLLSADFDAPSIRDASLEINLGDTHLLRVGVGDNEWRYYTIHVPTRTITQLAAFNSRQQIVQKQFSDDNQWLALSIQESEEYYITIMPMDGSQDLRTWDVETESYVCLLAWYEPQIPPPACSLYFGMG